MKTMRALRFEKFGPPSSLAVAEIAVPQPGPGEVLIQVTASGVNPSDLANVAGRFKASLPRVPGRDYAGIVVGGDGERGQEVWGSGPGFGVTRDGAHAEYVVAPADGLSVKPANLSMEQAATVGVPYTVAWWSLIHAAQLQDGETVLIVGASGAVGRAATQIVHARRGRVIGADRRSENPSGADVLINTTTQDLPREVMAATGGTGADVVLNAVGGPLFEPALQSLRRGGRHVVIASVGEPRVSFNLMDFYHNDARLVGVDSVRFSAPQIAAIMNELRPRFEAGDFSPQDIKLWPLDQGVAAYEAVAKGGAPVKHVLRMD